MRTDPVLYVWESDKADKPWRARFRFTDDCGEHHFASWWLGNDVRNAIEYGGVMMGRFTVYGRLRIVRSRGDPVRAK